MDTSPSDSMPTIRVDIVSDVVCPWCAIAYHQLARAAETSGVALQTHWHPFELNPNMAETGENLRAHLAAKYGTTPEESVKARARLTALGAAVGFTFNYADDMRMVNTFRAHQLIEWAGQYEMAHQAKLALFDAFFGRREDINDLAVLASVAELIGLDRENAHASLKSNKLEGVVREKEHFWTSRGITGVPAMVFERQHLVTGAQGEETYARILSHLVQHTAA